MKKIIVPKTDNKVEMIQVKELSQIQQLLIELMQFIHDVCEEHGLVYNIFGGTLLGAVRHMGMIPWDDDIDITMPRTDYDAFLDLLKTKYTDKVNVHAYPDERYIYPYAKIGLKDTILYELPVRRKYNKLNLNIDVFPVDGYPKNEDLFDVYSYYENMIIQHTYLPYTGRNVVKLIYKSLRNCVLNVLDRNDYSFYVREQIKMISEEKVTDSEYVICQAAGLGKKGKLKREFFFDRVQYDFAGHKFWGVRNYDDQLTRQYGDYMKLPPVNQREQSHTFILYVSKDIYCRFLKENGNVWNHN